MISVSMSAKTPQSFTKTILHELPQFVKNASL